MEIVEVVVTDRADSISAENGTAVNVRVFNVSNSHQVDLFVKMKQVEDRNILLCDASLLQVTFFRALFCLYGFD